MGKNKNRSFLYIEIILCLILVLDVCPLYAASVTLAWDAPTTNTDGSDLTDIAGYTLYYGTASGNYDHSIDVGNVTTYEVNNLSSGVTYYFASTVYDTSDNESGYSNEIDLIIQPPDTTPPVISGVQSSNITVSSATISWTTNEASSTQIQYGTNTSYGNSTTLAPAMVTGHSQNISGLAASTLYHYRVLSSDSSGNNAVSGDYTFTTSTPADTTPPVISGVQSSNITVSSATISWTTNEASSTQIQYGTNTSYGNSTTLAPAMVTGHSQNISGLAASTLYHYRVLSSDSSGNNAVSGDYTFTTSTPADTTPPVISGVQSSNITVSSATISWTTNEASSTQIQYGTNTSYGNSTTLAPAMVTGHSQNISGLAASTLYHYRVLSSDASGNNAVSGDYTFTTSTPADTTPPVISGVQSSNITVSSATISWTTNEASSTQIQYGTNTSYGNSTTLAPAMVTGHSQNISGLAASTLYHYRVLSSDASGNQAVSGDYTFTTSTPADTTPPVISGVQSSNITVSSATISWTTNEASSTQIQYGTNTSYGNSTTLAPAMVTGHSQNISGLAASTLYHYRVLSSDSSGNNAVSGDYTFTTSTPADTTPPVISGVQSSNITVSSATISWTTNEASSTQIQYGTNTSYGNSTTLAPAMVTGHSQNISGLAASTLYHYRVLSSDSSGNNAVSGDYTFTTSTPPTTFTYYCDKDNDGYKGTLTDGSCTGTSCEPAGCQTAPGNDCNDSDPAINPHAADMTCDGVDNDCDGTSDEDYLPAVISCGTGSCTSTGEIVCQSGSEANTCIPGTPEESPETSCGDGVDNDCDGEVDEGCVPDIKVSTVLLREDFSSGIPLSWQVQGSWSAHNQCGRTIGDPFAGPSALVDSSCTSTEVDQMVTESFDAVLCNRVKLAFSNHYYWYSGHSAVALSNDGGATWTETLRMDADDGYPAPQWKEVDISSLASAARGQIKFTYANTAAEGFWGLDNVWVSCESNRVDFSGQGEAQSVKTIMIANAGMDNLAIDTIEIVGADASAFSIGETDECTGRALLPAKTCTVDVLFTPDSAGNRTASMTIFSNDPDTPAAAVMLSGLEGTSQPLPSIKVNGAGGTVTLRRNNRTSATIALDPGNHNGKDADWWLLMHYRNRWYRYDERTGKWRRGDSVYRQGPLHTMGPVEVLNTSRLQRGQYRLYFGVDTFMNKVRESDQYYFDSVTVNVE